jgi:hypothetical protein
LLAISRDCGINLFVTTRLIPDITEHFQQSASVDIRASEADVRRYVAGHIGALPRFVLKDPELQEKISKTIADAVDGMCVQYNGA